MMKGGNFQTFYPSLREQYPPFISKSPAVASPKRQQLNNVWLPLLKNKS